MILEQNMQKYIEGLHKSDSKCRYLIEKAIENNVPIVTNEVAELLKVLIKSNSYKNIVEFGCGYGHSTISIASVMDLDAKFTSVDSSTGSIGFVSDELERQKSNAEGNYLRRLRNVTMCHETALSFLKRVKDEGKIFDFVFVDAVKKEYQEYFELILEVTYPGAIIVFDNVLWKGGVASESPTDKSIPLIKFNKNFMDDKRVQSAILPVGDGVAICVKQ